MFYIAGLSRNKQIIFFDFENYAFYDVALFMTYPKDLEELKKAKLHNPKLKTAIIDPRGSFIEPYIQYADFFILDSIEMKDFFAKYNKPMFTYYEYPDIPLVPKTHIQKEKIIIGYHGNKIHLTAMYPEITSALELLGERYNIEFWALYNIEHLGIWDIGVPKNIKVRHIQWSLDAYENHLSQVDIGLVPACMPVKKNIRKKSVVSRFFLDNEDDYIVKFKMPSNPGRIIIFAKLGVPVIADFLPSSIQFIKDGENGFLAKSTGGWCYALEQLIISHELRQSFADKMLKIYDEYFDFEVQNKKLIDFLERLMEDKSNEAKAVEMKSYFCENLKFNNAFLYEALKRVKRKLS